MAIGVTGSPATALGYHSELKPSASARLACSIILSMELPPPFSPMRMGRTIELHKLTARWLRWPEPLGKGRAMLTILSDRGRVAVDARANGDDLWVGAGDLERAT